MPIRVIEGDQRGWIHARAAGTLSLEEVLVFIRTVRAPIERRMLPLLFDARGATTDATDADVIAAVALVCDTVARSGLRGDAALVADDDRLYERMLLYETRCTEAGVRAIRVFRRVVDAERWLQIVSAAHNLR
jgi:hypothetical protein